MRFEVRVVQTQETTFFVEAKTEAEARDDAEALSDGIRYQDWDDVETDVDVVRHKGRLPKNARLWTGGADGDWK